MKTYKKLTLPPDSAWNRKSYNPYILLDKQIYKLKHNDYFDWIYDYWDKFIDTPYWNFKAGIKNLWRWFPVIWKDRDFDHHYIYEILQKKLEFQRQYLVSHNRCESTEVANKYITICLNLIERMKEQYYEMEYMDYEETEYIWESIKDDGEDKLVKLDIRQISENLDDYFLKYKIQYNKFRKKYSKETKSYLAHIIARENQLRCNRLFYNILEKQLFTWWD